MWLITPDGFYSAVQKPNTHELTIRARSGADLDRLRRRWIPELGPNEYDAGRDYPVRARCSHQAFAAGTARIAGSIDYSEFRAEVALRHSPERSRVYDKLWSGLLRIEREQTARGPFPRAPHKAKLSYGGLVLDPDRQRVLMRRSEDGSWGFFSGNPERGESPEQCALRVLRTQAGAEVQVRGSLFHWYADQARQCAYFLMELDEDPRLRDGGPGNTCWVELDAAEDLIRQGGAGMLPHVDLQVLEDLCNRLGYQPI